MRDLMTSVGHGNYVSWFRESEAMNCSEEWYVQGFYCLGYGRQIMGRMLGALLAGETGELTFQVCLRCSDEGRWG